VLRHGHAVRVRLCAQFAAAGPALAVEDATPAAELGPVADHAGAVLHRLCLPRHVRGAKPSAAAHCEQRRVVPAGLGPARARYVRGACEQGRARSEGGGNDSEAVIAGGDFTRAHAQRRVDAAVLEPAGEHKFAGTRDFKFVPAFFIVGRN